MTRFISVVAYDFYKRRINELCEQFPLVFNKKFPLPLAIGIHEALPSVTGFTQKEINALLRVWTRRREYASMATSLGWRYDLAGTPVCKIEEEQMKGFIATVCRFNGRTLHRWSKAFKELYGRPGFLFVPISARPEQESQSEQSS